mmetsp:Transcript_28372/g.54049  ORF Transcript_28372/g.54049 Transcript_28372/m.54049 type:complete len:243 (+) Transcript_28372:418-1146(+)
MVPEAHIDELQIHPPSSIGQERPPIRDLGLEPQHVEHGLHVHQGLPQLPVEEPQKTERSPQLQQQTVHQHQIPRGDAPRGHARHGVGGADTNGLGDGLARVEHARRVLRAHRRPLVVVQEVVVQGTSNGGVVEVLDGLHVDERVHRRAGGEVVQAVHLLAQLCGAAGEKDGPRDVHQEGGEHDERQHGVEVPREQPAHQHQLHQRGGERKHHRAKHHSHTSSSPIDDSREGTRAPLHVEANV